MITNWLPVEIWPYIESHVIRSSISRRWVGKAFRSILWAQELLTVEIVLLAKALWDANRDLVHVSMHAEQFLSSAKPPRVYEPGSTEEMEMLLQCSYAAWWQHESVLELLQAFKSIAGKNSMEDIERVMKSMEAKWDPGTEANHGKEDFVDGACKLSTLGIFVLRGARCCMPCQRSSVGNTTLKMAGKPRMQWFPYTDKYDNDRQYVHKAYTARCHNGAIKNNNNNN